MSESNGLMKYRYYNGWESPNTSKNENFSYDMQSNLLSSKLKFDKDFFTKKRPIATKASKDKPCLFNEASIAKGNIVIGLKAELKDGKY